MLSHSLFPVSFFSSMLELQSLIDETGVEDSQPFPVERKGGGDI